MMRWLEPFSRPRLRVFVIGVVGGLIVGALVAARLAVGQAVAVHSIQEAQSIALHDGRIEIAFTVDRYRECQTYTARWLWTWVTYQTKRVKLWVPLMPSSVSVTDAGRGQTLVLSLELPRGIWPAQWFYFSKSQDNCSWLPSFFAPRVRETPSIPIDIAAAEPHADQPITSTEEGRPIILAPSPLQEVHP
jgi:hypothetical protein